MEHKPLHCIVCGYERGGTTLIAELIRQHPNIDGRFEGGLLLADTLADFINLEPFASNVKRFWKVEQPDLEYICQADTWENGYERLIERSDIPDKQCSIYDKTPRYTQFLDKIIPKADVPVLCVVRDPRSLYWSRKKRWPEVFVGDETDEQPHKIWRQKFPNNLAMKVLLRARTPKRLRNFVHNYLRYANSWKKADQLFPGKILLVQHEKLCTTPLSEAQRIYDFLGLEFKIEYLGLPNTENPYVARGGITDNVVWEYIPHLSDWEQQQLLSSTQAFSDWHWHGKNPSTNSI